MSKKRLARLKLWAGPSIIYDIQAENNQQNNAQRKAALDRRERELRERERELDRREDEIRDRELGYREERRSPRW